MSLPNPSNTSDTSKHPDSPARRVALVTGAGTGIGRATAHAFAGQGLHVVVVGRRRGPPDETAGAAPDLIRPPAADITADGAPESIVRSVLAEHGRLDVLVNNAGIVRDGRLGSYTRELIETQVATNLVAPVLLTQAALPALAADGGGVVVNVTTSAGQRGRPGNAVYPATELRRDGH